MKKNINILLKNMKEVALNIVKIQRLLIEDIYKNIKYYNPGKEQIVLIVIDFWLIYFENTK